MTDTTASRTTGAVAAGLATLTADGSVLDTWFPAPELSAEPGPAGTERLSAERAVELLGEGAAQAIGPDARRGVEVVAVRTVIASLHDKPLDAHDAYLRLHLLSHRLVKPHGQNLDGLFGLLANVAWTSLGPVAVDDIEKVRLNARAAWPAPPGDLHRQVPAHDGLRRPEGRPDRRRRPGPPRRAPRRGHDGHARGLRELQRGHARHLHGRGPHLRRRRGRQRLGHRRRRLHHGHPVRRRQRPHHHRRALPRRCGGGVGIALGDECVVEAGLYVTASTRA